MLTLAAPAALLSWGVIDEPLEWLLFSDFAVILAFVHLYTLFMVVPIFNTMMRIDRSLLEAARDAGASKFRVFRGITLRMAAPGIFVAMVMSFISAFDEAQGTYLVGAPSLYTMPTEMYALVLNYPVQIAAVFSILMAAPSVVLIGLVRKQIISGQLAEGFQIK